MGGGGSQIDPRAFLGLKNFMLVTKTIVGQMKNLNSDIFCRHKLHLAKIENLV